VNVAYYCQDAVGLGHVRRTIDIASRLARLEPEVDQLIISGTPAVGTFSREPGIDALVLPDWGAAPQQSLRRSASRQQAREFLQRRQRLREALITTAIAQFSPRVLLVDNSPLGMKDELAPLLAGLDGASDRPQRWLGFRDFLNYREEIVRKWTKRGIYDRLRDAYDRIFIYGQREVFDFAEVYGFPADVRAKTIYCGYVKELRIETPPEDVRAELGVAAAQLVVVTVGGGDDGEPLLRLAAAVATDTASAPFHLHLVTGPLTSAAVAHELAEVSASAPNMTVERFNSAMHSLLNAADLVVSMGGYNTMIEVAGLGKRALVAPRPGSGEQAQRANRFAALGLVRLLDPSTLTARLLATAIQDALSSPAPTFRLDLGGLDVVGEALAKAVQACPQSTAP
jgi:predicted glycosyltransferase